MAWVKVEEGTVAQRQPYHQDGFIEATDDVVCGMTWDGDAFSVPFDLQSAKSEAKRRAAEEKNRGRDGGFLVDGVQFDSDMAARIAYAELAIHLQTDPTFTVYWKASEGVWVTMTASLLVAVYAAGQIHIQSCFAWYAQKEAEIDAVTSKEQLEAVSLSIGG